MLSEKGHFYGRRKGRPLRSKRLQSLEQDQLIIPELSAVTHPRDLFDKPYKSYALEIGFGNGEHVVQQAVRDTETGFIGCEAFMNGVTACLMDAQQRNANNVRIWPDDALLLLPKIQPESLNTIYLLFSDPWPKTKHHKRRFVQKETAALMAGLLVRGGMLRIATDDHNLAQWSLLQCVQEPHLQWTCFQNAEWRTQPQDWIETRYQQKAAEQGRQPFFMDFEKV